jgi:hypothetical protein
MAGMLWLPIESVGQSRTTATIAGRNNSGQYMDCAFRMIAEAGTALRGRLDNITLAAVSCENPNSLVTELASWQTLSQAQSGAR